jgi:GNAT superfamily N-acetyltransferase
VGTVCVAEDQHRNKNSGQRECIFGFLDYVEDFAVAEALLDRAVAWANEHSLDCLFGPFNLDREDSYGVLVEGRDRPPVILCGHTPPYYIDFMERYGMCKARGDNIAFAVDIDQDTPALRRLDRLAQRVQERSGFVIRTPDLANWETEVDNVHHLLDQALAHLPDHVVWNREDLSNLLAPFRDMADLDLILFADIDDQTVGFFPGLPDLNEALIHANGLRYPWDYARLWWHMRRQPACLAVKSVLVLPEYWDTGVAVLLFAEMVRRARAKGYEWLDLSLTSEENPRTPILAKRMGARIYKRYRTYRLWL